jgi:hypothetical protein
LFSCSAESCSLSSFARAASPEAFAAFASAIRALRSLAAGSDQNQA